MNRYSYDLDDKLASKLKKLAKRNQTLYTAVQKKMLRITENPYLGKPLKKVLKGKRRVHIGFLEFEHHDDAYN